MSGRRKGGQVTPPRAALAAGEITAPSLLARDVHKLCITASGAHVSEPREREHTAIGKVGGATLLAPPTFPGALLRKGLVAQS